jgi:predicted DsbA family dithiol-disulfide isomerase
MTQEKRRMPEALSISVFSDVICPWCFLGKRRLERALNQLGPAGTAVIRWLPYELNPDMPADGMKRAVYRARKFGAERAFALDRDMTELGLGEGIRFAFDRMERTPNTRKAHLLIAMASRRGLGGAAAEALFTAYFEEGRDIGREDVLAEIALAIGLDQAQAEAAFSDDSLRASVVDIETEAARLGIGGVPFFIIDNAWSVSGAQPREAWLDVLRRVRSSGSEIPVG